jgi:hypothetical protein
MLHDASVVSSRCCQDKVLVVTTDRFCVFIDFSSPRVGVCMHVFICICMRVCMCMYVCCASHGPFFSDFSFFLDVCK